MTLSPRQKLFSAVFLVLLVAGLSLIPGASAATLARLALGLCAAAGLGAWFLHARGGLPSSFKTAPRLNVVQRVGLSQRTGLALVEIDGRPYVIVHGDGFARMRPAQRPTRIQPRAPLAPVSAPPAVLS